MENKEYNHEKNETMLKVILALQIAIIAILVSFVTVTAVFFFCNRYNPPMESDTPPDMREYHEQYLDMGYERL